eukprot:NODE_2428_length_1423_cov_7.385385_g2310_i0.p1 GENE.NODE_2428_length_1423_cov_7.385385_g2310_i0~~NODE_2428_length_1423_cov_7.385385_g2310_i0.p1  ORF type:complete len:400 (-),score=69.63 NODE_2428_length_1423_cov_7.385385_g2310_i0:47-1246(-)
MAHRTEQLDFQIGNKIGEGGFGVVYRGIHRPSGKFVAIKELKLTGCTTAGISRVQKEFALLQRLQHPNITRVFGFNYSAETRQGLIVMEYVSGGALSTVLQQFGALSTETTAHYTKQILDGLVYLHKEGVIHRDIKPHNILVHVSGSIKLADFGASKEVTDLSATGTEAFGTPNYMSPEMVRNQHASFASDVWAVGCTVLELLTALRPGHHLEITSLVSLIFHIGTSNDHPEIPSTLADEAKGFLCATFSQEPADRPTAETLLGDPFMLLGEVPPLQPCESLVHEFSIGRTKSSESSVGITPDRSDASVTVDTFTSSASYFNTDGVGSSTKSIANSSPSNLSVPPASVEGPASRRVSRTDAVAVKRLINSGNSGWDLLDQGLIESRTESSILLGLPLPV